MIIANVGEGMDASFGMLCMIVGAVFLLILVIVVATGVRKKPGEEHGFPVITPTYFSNHENSN